jgi:hypothetical protein
LNVAQCCIVANVLQIVDKDSASLNLPNEVAVGAAGANYKSICKFSCADSQKFSPAWRAIKNLVDSALADSTCRTFGKVYGVNWLIDDVLQSI